MKKKIIAILAASLCVALLCTSALATSRVPEMEFDVALRPDGAAHITQIWTTDADEGTEFYLGCRDSGYLTITDFSVSDQNGPYVYVEDWDVDASFEEKANRCGFLRPARAWSYAGASANTGITAIPLNMCSMIWWETTPTQTASTTALWTR